MAPMLGFILTLSTMLLWSTACAGSLLKPVPPPGSADSLRVIEAALNMKSAPDTVVALGYYGGWYAYSDSGRQQLAALEGLRARANGAVRKEWRPVVVLPALKITESTRENAEVDGALLTSVGGGISWQRLVWDSNKGDTGAWRSTLSLSPLTILVSGDFNETNSILNISPAMTAGFWNNLFMMGIGYDLGEVGDRSRWFGLLSIGINFNN